MKVLKILNTNVGWATNSSSYGGAYDPRMSKNENRNLYATLSFAANFPVINTDDEIITCDCDFRSDEGASFEMNAFALKLDSKDYEIIKNIVNDEVIDLWDLGEDQELKDRILKNKDDVKNIKNENLRNLFSLKGYNFDNLIKDLAKDYTEFDILAYEYYYIGLTVDNYLTFSDSQLTEYSRD